MVKPIALANASTVVALVIYVVCRVVSLIAPDFLFNIAQSWFHTFSTESVANVAPMNIGTFIFGAITLSVLVWAAAYAGATLYNKLAK